MKYNKVKREIISDKRLSELDKLTLEFVNILKKYVDYVIISGYVVIILGRSRATEDIGVYVKPFSRDKFSLFYKEIKNNNFWCLNSKSEKEVFDYLQSKIPVRFAKKNTTMPNFEVKYPRDKLSEDTLTIILSKGKLIISSLEREIAFKRYYLKSNKDIEDAIHIEEIFKEDLDYGKINKLKEIIERK